MTDTPDLALARKVLATQPFSVLLGARLTAFGDGEAVLEVDLREELLQQNGFAHGGLLSYAADNALSFAAGSAVGLGVLSAGFTIDFLRPAKGETLRAHARVIRAGRTRAVCRCDLATVDGDGAETLCAVAQGTIALTGPTREPRVEPSDDGSAHEAWIWREGRERLTVDPPRIAGGEVAVSDTACQGPRSCAGRACGRRRGRRRPGARHRAGSG